MFRNSVIHKIFSEFLQPFQVCRNARASQYVRDPLSSKQRFSPLVSFPQHLHLTQALDGNRSHSDLPFLESTLSLDTVVVGEVDELEEDVG